MAFEDNDGHKAKRGLDALKQNMQAHLPELSHLACPKCGHTEPTTKAEAVDYTFSGWPPCPRGHRPMLLITKKEANANGTGK